MDKQSRGIREYEIGEEIFPNFIVNALLSDPNRETGGLVYLVNCGRLRSSFIAKSFRPSRIDRNPTVMKEFRKEAEIWIGLGHHSHIAPGLSVRASSRGEAWPFILSVYYPDTLRNIVQQGRCSEAEAVRYVIQIADGMEHAVARGLIAHRDLKPENCLIDWNGEIRICDFGIASSTAFLDETNEIGQSSFSTTGTISYMAPEQFSGSSETDQRADIYSVGIMLFELLLGRVPFEADDVFAMASLHRTAKVQMPKTLDDQLTFVLKTCLAKRPEDRYRSFTELKRDLLKWCIGHGVKHGIVDDERVRVLDLYSIGALARLHLGFGECEKCIECVERIEASPLHSLLAAGRDVLSSSEALRAAALSNLGRHKDALVVARQCETSKLKDPTSWKLLGNVYARAGKMHKALKTYDRALKIDPKEPLANCNKGKVLEAIWRPDEALECYEREYLNCPFLLENLIVWADLLAERKLDGKAEQVICKALSLSPNNSKLVMRYAKLLYRAKKHKEATEILGNVLDCEPANTDLWIEKAHHHLNIGELKEAHYCFKVATELDPELLAGDAGLIRALLGFEGSKEHNQA